MKTGYKKWIVYVSAGLLGILAALALTCAFSIRSVQGDSMDPAVSKGEHVIVNKLAYFFDQPEQGDVVAFPCSVYSEDGEGSTLIKRVVATEGDQVEIKDGALYINGEIFDRYAADPVYMEAVSYTHLSKSEPVFGGVYKLSALEKDGVMIPKIKISENVEKITNPGFKTVYRLFDKDTDKTIADVITLDGEPAPGGEDYVIFDPQAI